MQHGSPFTGSRFRRALRWFLVGRFAQAAATLGLTLLAVRLLDPVDYGAYMVVWGLVELATPLTSLGLLPAVQRFLPEYASNGSPRALKRFVLLATVARLALIACFCVVVAVAWPTFATFIDAPVGPAAFPWLVAGLLTGILISRFAAEMLECLLEQRFAQTARATLPLLRLSGLLYLWVAGEVSLVNVLLVDMIAGVVAAILAELWLARCIRVLRPAGDPSVVSTSELLAYVWHMSTAQLLNAVSSVGTLRILVASVLGIEVAGRFAFLQQLIVIGGRYLPSTLLANMIRPLLISRHAAGHAESVATGLGLLWKINVAVAWPLVVLAWIVGDAVVAALSGGRFTDAGLVFLLLLVGLVAAAQIQVVVMALQVYRYASLVRNLSVFALLVPACAWFGARWGLEGVALGIALASLVRSGAGMWLLQGLPKHASLDYMGVAKVFASLALAGAAAAALREQLSWGLCVAAFALVYLGTAAWLRPLASGESALLLRALGSRFGWINGVTARQ